MRVLVTGANGFLGRRVIEALGSTTAEVHAVSRHERTGSPVHWHTADLLDGAQRDQVITAVAPTHLIHLAWTTEHGQFWNSPFNDAWHQATLSLLEGFAKGGGQRAVAAGSCAEYDWTDPLLASEKCDEFSTPLASANPYGKAKLATFHAATEVATAYGFDMAWARFFFLFGIDEHAGRLVPALIRASLAGETIDLQHPNRILDFMSTADAAAAVVALVDSDLVGPVNIATGRGVRISAIAEIVQRLAGHEIVIRSNHEGAASSPDLRLVADITRLSTEAGFHPKYDLEGSLAQAIEWWRSRVDDPHQDFTDPSHENAT